MKYEFTGETKIKFGVTLRRIRAPVEIKAARVAKGDLGGWIEVCLALTRVSGDHAAGEMIVAQNRAELLRD